METSTYLDGKVIAASKNFVNIIAHREDSHGTREVVVGKEKQTWCKAYWGISCEVHKKGSAASGRFSGISGVPCTLFCDTDGNEVSRQPGGMGAGELVKAMTAALAKVPGEHVSATDWSGAKKILEEAGQKLEKGEIKKAIELELKVARHKIKAIQALAADTAKLIDEKGAALVAEAKEKIESDKAAAKKALQKIADDFKGFDCAKAAQELLATLKDAK